MLHFLVTAHSFMSAYAVAKQTQKAQSYGFCKCVYWPVGPMRSAFVFQLQTRVDVKTTVLWGRPQNEHCAPGFSVHTR